MSDDAQAKPKSSELSDDQIIDILRKVMRADLFKMLTFQRWKDGIEIDHPTFVAQQLAEEFRAAAPPPLTPAYSAPEPTEEDWSCVSDFLDDIEVNAAGMCRWADVANAQTHIRHAMRAVQRKNSPSVSSPDDMRRAHLTPKLTPQSSDPAYAPREITSASDFVRRLRKYNAAHLAYELSHDEAVDALLLFFGPTPSLSSTKDK